MPSQTNTSKALAPNFSSKHFRSALGMFATGVTIITARTGTGLHIGLTANSFNSVSMSPPLVLWSLARSAESLAKFRDATHYAINVLNITQKDLALRFASKSDDRFAGVPLRIGATGAPLIEGAIASFECFNRSRYEEGDHVIFVGEVEHCQYKAGAAPLLFYGGLFFTDHPL